VIAGWDGMSLCDIENGKEYNFTNEIILSMAVDAEQGITGKGEEELI
jgi:hypothetical protein